jgi:hypothetical protein
MFLRVCPNFKSLELEAADGQKYIKFPLDNCIFIDDNDISKGFNRKMLYRFEDGTQFKINFNKTGSPSYLAILNKNYNFFNVSFLFFETPFNVPWNSVAVQEIPTKDELKYAACLDYSINSWIENDLFKMIGYLNDLTKITPTRIESERTYCLLGQMSKSILIGNVGEAQALAYYNKAYSLLGPDQLIKKSMPSRNPIETSILYMLRYYYSNSSWNKYFKNRIGKLTNILDVSKYKFVPTPQSDPFNYYLETMPKLSPDNWQHTAQSLSLVPSQTNVLFLEAGYETVSKLLISVLNFGMDKFSHGPSENIGKDLKALRMVWNSIPEKYKDKYNEKLSMLENQKEQMDQFVPGKMNVIELEREVVNTGKFNDVRLPLSQSAYNRFFFDKDYNLDTILLGPSKKASWWDPGYLDWFFYSSFQLLSAENNFPKFKKLKAEQIDSILSANNLFRDQDASGLIFLPGTLLLAAFYEPDKYIKSLINENINDNLDINSETVFHDIDLTGIVLKKK